MRTEQKGKDIVYNESQVIYLLENWAISKGKGNSKMKPVVVNVNMCVCVALQNSEHT
jgi:hypothetical protein